MKIKYFFILAGLLILPIVFADEVQVQETQSTTPQSIFFENCTKMFGINKENLYYLTLGAVNANRFKTEEIQTNNGYIIFAVNKDKYLATISEIDKNNSILKITPCNNVYYFQPGIISNIYKYIDLNKDLIK